MRATAAQPHRGVLEPRGAHHHPVRAGARDLLPVPRCQRQLHVRHRVQLLRFGL